MKKVFLRSIIFISLFVLASSVFAQSQQIEIVNPLKAGDIPTLLTNIALGVAFLVGAISTIMIIWAGILFLTSAGSAERMGTAKKALFYAIIGIVIAAMAGTIVAVIKEIIGVK